MPNEPEVKGPDPKVWGAEKNRPSPLPDTEVAIVDGVDVKGPDPKQWK